MLRYIPAILAGLLLVSCSVATPTPTHTPVTATPTPTVLASLPFGAYGFFPKKDASDVPVTAAIAVSFTRRPSVVDLTLEPEVQIASVEREKVSVASARYTFVLANLLEPATTYTATLTFGQETAPPGFAATQTVSWRFTTEAQIEPTATPTRPPLTKTGPKPTNTPTRGPTPTPTQTPAGQDSPPSCGIDTELFSVPPLLLSDIVSIVPLGNLNPPGHTFPTNHLYLGIRKSDPDSHESPPAEVPLFSPGDIWITRISTSQNITGGYTDYSISFSPCAEFEAYFLHVTSISQKISDTLDASPPDYCNEYETGGNSYRHCSANVNIPLEAGEVMGTAGGRLGQNALDFGAADRRTGPLTYASPDRWDDGSSQHHLVCGLDYFEPEARGQLKGLLGGWGEGSRRTIEPICGEVEQDEPGTAQGVWFAKGTRDTHPEDLHIALVHDNVDPSWSVFSVGTSMAGNGLASGTYYFQPSPSGLMNRDFDEVVSDGQTYCYEPKDWPGDAPSLSSIILVQLTTETMVRIEAQNAAGCGTGPWAFGDTYTDFER